ncbi:glycogen debranching protein, partial [bacterium]|nr:glycogen debranching protein [bacterium]
PYGLRTLSPRDPAFVPRYEGGPEQRDRAYHKGTVWPWLLGPYLTAKVRFGAKGKEIERKEARTLFFRALEGLLHGGIGTLSEIYDGTAPHLPRGCPAQAWSVAELLRVYREDLMSSPL